MLWCIRWLIAFRDKVRVLKSCKEFVKSRLTCIREYKILSAHLAVILKNTIRTRVWPITAWEKPGPLCVCVCVWKTSCNRSCHPAKQVTMHSFCSSPHIPALKHTHWSLRSTNTRALKAALQQLTDTTAGWWWAHRLVMSRNVESRWRG